MAALQVLVHKLQGLLNDPHPGLKTWRDEVGSAFIDVSNWCPAPSAEFGRAVLKLLEEEKEWDADLFDLIAAIAHNMGLGTVDENGLFKRTRA